MTWSRFQMVCNRGLQLDSPWPFCFLNQDMEFFEGCCKKSSTHTLQNRILLFLYRFLIFKGCNADTHLMIHCVHLLSLLCTALERKCTSCDPDTGHPLSEWLAIKSMHPFSHVYTWKCSPMYGMHELCSQLVSTCWCTYLSWYGVQVQQN